MSLRWNPILVEEDHGVMLVHDTPDGKRLLPGLNIAARNEDVDQVRAGYRCINCWEPLDSEHGGPFPKHCFLCGYPCRDRQAEEFARSYKGYDPTVNGQINWDLEEQRLGERAERRRFAERAKESRIFLGSKSIGNALKRMKGVA